MCIFINYEFFKYSKNKTRRTRFLISFGTFYLFAARAACRQLAQTFELHTRRRGTRNDNTTIPPTAGAVGMKAQKQLFIVRMAKTDIALCEWYIASVTATGVLPLSVVFKVIEFHCFIIIGNLKIFNTICKSQTDKKIGKL